MPCDKEDPSRYDLTESKHSRVFQHSPPQHPLGEPKHAGRHDGSECIVCSVSSSLSRYLSNFGFGSMERAPRRRPLHQRKRCSRRLRGSRWLSCCWGSVILHRHTWRIDHLLLFTSGSRDALRELCIGEPRQKQWRNKRTEQAESAADFLAALTEPNLFQKGTTVRPAQ